MIDPYAFFIPPGRVWKSRIPPFIRAHSSLETDWVASIVPLTPMAVCYSKTFIDVVADASSVVRSQSTPPRKLCDAFPSDPHSLDEVMALDVLHENAKTRLQVFRLQQRSEQISSLGTWRSPNSLQNSERQVIGVSPSVGSAGHPEICWRPCVLFAKGHCELEQDCNFCHLHHERPPMSLDKKQRDFLKALHEVNFMKMILPYVRKQVEECDLPGAPAVLQLLQSEISIRSHPVPPPSRKTPGTIRFALRKMTLANLVSLLCSIMTHRRFGKLMFSELENVRKTAVKLGE